MSLVSPSQSSPGGEITAAAINTPVNQLAAVVNGNIDSTNIAASGIGTTQLASSSVTNAKLSTTAGELGGAWTAYTPTWSKASGTAPTLGNSTLQGYYKQIGKTVHVYFNFVIGSTSLANGTEAWLFALPFAPATTITSMNTNPNLIVGTFYIEDLATTGYLGFPAIYTGTQFSVKCFGATNSTTMNSINSALPFVFGVGDFIRGSFTYECA